MLNSGGASFERTHWKLSQPNRREGSQWSGIEVPALRSELRRRFVSADAAGTRTVSVSKITIPRVRMPPTMMRSRYGSHLQLTEATISPIMFFWHVLDYP